MITYKCVEDIFFFFRIHVEDYGYRWCAIGICREWDPRPTLAFHEISSGNHTFIICRVAILVLNTKDFTGILFPLGFHFVPAFKEFSLIQFIIEVMAAAFSVPYMLQFKWLTGHTQCHPRHPSMWPSLPLSSHIVSTSPSQTPVHIFSPSLLQLWMQFSKILWQCTALTLSAFLLGVSFQSTPWLSLLLAPSASRSFYLPPYSQPSDNIWYTRVIHLGDPLSPAWHLFWHSVGLQWHCRHSTCSHISPAAFSSGSNCGYTARSEWPTKFQNKGTFDGIQQHSPSSLSPIGDSSESCWHPTFGHCAQCPWK